jgi:hypothetical protein
VLPSVLLLHAAASCLGAAEVSVAATAPASPAATVPKPGSLEAGQEPVASCVAPSRAARPHSYAAHAVSLADVDRVREPSPRLSLGWALFQLLPSPGVAFGEQGARFGLRWQVTPVLYSFALDSRLSPWRWFVVEPIVRQSGSVELFLSPEYLALEGGAAERFGVRAGLRGYLGVIQRGDYLSVSLGSSYHHFENADGISVEAGAQILFGSLGLFVEHSPGFDAAPWYVSLRLRYF